jgi:hypothetical protein
MSTETPPGRSPAPQFVVRLPDEQFRDRIATAAQRNGRSMNSEIVARIQEGFDAAPLLDAARAELAATQVELRALRAYMAEAEKRWRMEEQDLLAQVAVQKSSQARFIEQEEKHKAVHDALRFGASAQAAVVQMLAAALIELGARAPKNLQQAAEILRVLAGIGKALAGGQNQQVADQARDLVGSVKEAKAARGSAAPGDAVAERKPIGVEMRTKRTVSKRG